MLASTRVIGERITPLKCEYTSRGAVVPQQVDLFVRIECGSKRHTEVGCVALPHSRGQQREVI